MHMYTSHQGVHFFALVEGGRCGFPKVDRMETVKVFSHFTLTLYIIMQMNWFLTMK